MTDALDCSHRRQIALYLSSHVAKSLLWSASDVLTLWVLVSLFLVDPAMAGLVFLVGLIANAAADVAVGVWLDRHPTHTRRLTAIGLVAASATFPATMLTAGLNIGLMLAATLIFRVAYAAYDVTHNAQMSHLALTAQGTLLLSRGRTVGTSVAGLVVALGVRESVSAAETVAPVLWILAAFAAVGCSCLLPLLPLEGKTLRRKALLRKPGMSPAFLLANMAGIIALGAVAKATLHLSSSVSSEAGSMLTLLMLGRMVSAIVPVRFVDARRGILLLGLAYVFAAILVNVVGLGSIGWLGIMGLGLALGLTNLLGWALLPLLAKGPREYGVYTMASKLALGLSGFILTLMLGHRAMIDQAEFAAMGVGAAVACCAAALMLAQASRSTPRG